MIHVRPCFHLLLIAGLFLTGCGKTESPRPSSAVKSAPTELSVMAPASEMIGRENRRRDKVRDRAATSTT